MPGLRFFSLENIFFGRIYLPITAFVEGALLIVGFSITSLIKKLFLLSLLDNEYMPHLLTLFFLTFILAITEHLFFILMLIISFEQLFFTIKSSGNNIKKYLSFINFFVLSTASPVPKGLF